MFKELKKYLISHPGGKEIINFYREKKTLDDPNRKKLVNISVEHMLQYMPENTLPCTQTKIDYAKTIIQLFPNLKDKYTEAGYVSAVESVSSLALMMFVFILGSIFWSYNQEGMDY